MFLAALLNGPRVSKSDTEAVTSAADDAQEENWYIFYGKLAPIFSVSREDKEKVLLQLTQ